MSGEQLESAVEDVVNDDDVERLINEDKEAKNQAEQTRLDESRWNEDKALAIGTAARQAAAEEAGDNPEKDPYYYKNIEEHRRVSEGPSLDDLRARDRGVQWKDEAPINEHEKNVKWFENKIKEVEEADDVELQRLLQDHQTRESRLEELRQRKSEAQEELKSRIKEQIPIVKHDARLDADEEVGRRGRQIETLNDRFEAFYELNPEAFKQMPTQEFISAYKELKEIEQELTESEDGLSRITERLNQVDKSIEGEIAITQYSEFERVSIDGLASSMSKLGLPKEELKELKTRLSGAYLTDNFNKTPRQIAEEVRGIVAEYVEKMRQKFAAAEQRKQEFMQKHGIKSESDETAAEAQN